MRLGRVGGSVNLAYSWPAPARTAEQRQPAQPIAMSCPFAATQRGRGLFESRHTSPVEQAAAATLGHGGHAMENSQPAQAAE